MHTHSKIGKLIWLVVIAALVLVGFFFYKSQTASDSMDNVDIVSPEIPKGKVGMSLYENYLYSFKFEYPENLYMKEQEGVLGKSDLSMVLVEGTKENIDLIEGRYSGPGREGPTMISIDVYKNEKMLSSEEWAKQDVNWNTGDKEVSFIKVNGIQAVAYSWSGLYEGENVIITKGQKAYVFSVTWMNPEDQILKDFDMILKSFTFVE